MLDISYEEILKVTGGEMLQGNIRALIKGFSIDTRTLKPGDCFVALEGEHTDGHKYILDAMEKGASGAIISYINEGESYPANRTLIRVKEPLEALQKISSYYRNKFSLKVIGVTGSSGKTTTKDFIASVLGYSFKTLKTEGNLNNHLGLPLILLRLKKEHQAVVLEMGMRNRGEISLLTRLSRPEVGVITNIGEAHLELLGSKDEIAKAKGELLEEMNSGNTAILNGDNYWLRRIAEEFKGKGKAILYGLQGEVDIKAYGLTPKNKGTDFKVNIRGQEEDFFIPLPGEHNVYNALAAVTCALYFGVPLQEIKMGLANPDLTGMRMEIIDASRGVTIMNDAYNANLSSTKASLKTLALIGKGSRLIAVLGDMLELGSIKEEAHKEVGQFAASIGVDTILGVGDLMLITVTEARERGVSNSWHFTDHVKLKKKLSEITQPGDYILVKGSRGMKMEKIVEFLK